MNPTEHNKTFRFILEQEDVVLFEKIFDGDAISPHTRNFVDIRPCLQGLIRQIQRGLSLNHYDHIFAVNNEVVYDFIDEHNKMLENYEPYGNDEMIYDPKPITKKVDGKEIKGVYCKIGLFINENLIVEREFYVDNFNPECRWSNELISMMNDVVEKIQTKILDKDKQNIWDDYDIINRTGMTIAQVRGLANSERNYWLRRINF